MLNHISIRSTQLFRKVFLLPKTSTLPTHPIRPTALPLTNELRERHPISEQLRHLLQRLPLRLGIEHEEAECRDNITSNKHSIVPPLNRSKSHRTNLVEHQADTSAHERTDGGRTGPKWRREDLGNVDELDCVVAQAENDGEDEDPCYGEALADQVAAFGEVTREGHDEYHVDAERDVGPGEGLLPANPVDKAEANGIRYNAHHAVACGSPEDAATFDANASEQLRLVVIDDLERCISMVPRHNTRLNLR